MLERIHFNLPNYYLSQSLDTESLKKVLGSNDIVFKNLLIIKNGYKAAYDFAYLENNNYELDAYVKVDYAVIGKAKSQAWAVTHFKPILSSKPKYTLICTLKDLKSNKTIYKHKESSIKSEIIYKNIENCFTDLQILLDSF
jgi:hypothetical protein